ncbi:MAG: hypothetical protein J3K34DRAFT_521645 [Monoraphidium minutum]|nr:MAG: hypothetical protein J3K34DRAFT_521645 [Monoraphidium minutum]
MDRPAPAECQLRQGQCGQARRELLSAGPTTPAPRSRGAAALLDWSNPKTESPFQAYESQADAAFRRRFEETSRVSGPPVRCYGADGDRFLFDLATHNRRVPVRPFVPADAPDAARSFQEPYLLPPAPAAVPTEPVPTASSVTAPVAAGVAQPATATVVVAAAVAAAASPSASASPKPATISAASPAAARAGRKTTAGGVASRHDKRRADRASKQQRREARRAAARQKETANKPSQGAAGPAAAADDRGTPASQEGPATAAAAIAIAPIAAEPIQLLQRQLAALQARERRLVKALDKESAARATAEAAASAAHKKATAAERKLGRAKASFAKIVAKLQQQVSAGAAEAADLCGALALAAQQMQQEQPLKQKQPKAARPVKGAAPLPASCPKPKAAARLLAAAVGKAKKGQARRSRSPAGPKGEGGAGAEGGAPAGPLLMRDDSAREREGAAGLGSGGKECKQHAQQITEQEHTACDGERGAALLLPVSGGGGCAKGRGGGVPSFRLEVACFDEAGCGSEDGGVLVVVGAAGAARGPMWGPPALMRCLCAAGERVGAAYALGLLRALGLSAGGA